MLRQCQWEGREVNCSQIFKPVITDTGVCCAFNLQSDLTESDYSRLVEETQVRLIYDAHQTDFNQVRTGAPNGIGIKRVTPRLDKGLKIIIDRNFDR